MLQLNVKFKKKESGKSCEENLKFKRYRQLLTTSDDFISPRSEKYYRNVDIKCTRNDISLLNYK